jgi:hypothetical protein
MWTDSSAEGPVAETCNTTPMKLKVSEKARKIHGLAKKKMFPSTP